MAGAVFIASAVSCIHGEINKKTEDAIQGWGQPLISVACMRYEPRHGSELVSQCLLGVPVAIMAHDGEWLDVMTPEGYRGWVNQSSIVEKSDSEMARWRTAERFVVDSPKEILVYDSMSLDAKHGVVTDLVDGCLVEGKMISDKVLSIQLPDGRKGYADRNSFTEIGEWSNQSYDAEKIIARANALSGVPYLWGGLSTKSMDCSGLVKLCYWSNGIIVPRDASQQACCGTVVEKTDLERGDLLFFGNEETGRVTHVGIYEGEGMYMHSSGRVRRNSLDFGSPEYIEKHYLLGRRLRDITGHDGVTRVKDHHWFF